MKSALAERMKALREQARQRASRAGLSLDRASRRLSGRLSAIAFAGLVAVPLLPTLAGKPAQPERTSVEIVQTRRLDIAGRPMAIEPGTGFAKAAVGDRVRPAGDMGGTGQGASPADAPLRIARKETRAKTDGATTDEAGKADEAERPSKSESAAKSEKAGQGEKGDKTKKVEKPDDKPMPVPPASAPTEPQPEAWSEAEIGEARKQCATLLTGLPLEGDEADPVRNGACGTPAPITLKKAGGGKTELHPAALVNCRMAVALNAWIDDVLQPAAREAFGQSVTRILTASSYVCRNRYGGASTPISEHAFANALDISGFVLADGRVVKVVDGWGPNRRDIAALAEAAAAAPVASAAKPVSKDGGKVTDAKAADAKPSDAKADTKTADATKPASAKGGVKPGVIKGAQAATLPVPASTAVGKNAEGGKTGAFLRKLHTGACTTFGTVLGPEANEAHRDHLHFDLKQRRAAHVCD